MARPASQINPKKPGICLSVFVDGLSFIVTEEDLCTALCRCGDIDSTPIARRNDRSRGFGFIDFKHTDSVDAAIDLAGTVPVPTGIQIKSCTIRVDYSHQKNDCSFSIRGDWLLQENQCHTTNL